MLKFILFAGLSPMDPQTQNFLQGNELQVIAGSFIVGIRTKLLWLIGR